MEATVRIQQELVVRVWTCNTCGVLYGLTKEFDDSRRQTLRSFYCPNGHGQSYNGKTREQAVAEEQVRTAEALEQARRLQAALDATMDTLAKERKTATALKARVGNGVCPDCSRTFKNLALHTRSKHRGAEEAHAVAKEMTARP